MDIRQALIDPATCQKTVQQVAVTLGRPNFFPRQKVNWQKTSLLNSVQRFVETNIHQSLFLALLIS